MKKTILTLAMIMAGILGIQAQIQTLQLNDGLGGLELVDRINAAAEKGGKWTIRFSDRAINLDNWNVLVLPFDVYFLTLSKAFGYAVIDVLDERNDVPNSMHFQIVTEGTIPAGTPFLIKVSADYNKDNLKKVYSFTGVTVKKVEAQMVKTDKNGNRFIGVFSPTTFYGKDCWYMSKGLWKRASLFTEEKPVSLKPLRAYIDMSDAKSKSAEAQMIIIDEPDGTTTVIDAATFNKGEFNSNADNGWYTITGMRLVDEPTEKGVYIHNARKVIIK